MKKLAGGREIDAVLVSVGVNDLGFGALVGHCITNDNCPASRFPDSDSPETLDQVMKQRLAALSEPKNGRFNSLSRSLKRAGIPARRVFITEYFDSTRDENEAFCNPLIYTPLGSFDQAEAEWAYRQILSPLNAAIRTAATRHGWRLVTGAEAGFREHGYCSQDSWIVKLTESLANQSNKEGTLHSTTWGNFFQASLVVNRMRTELYAGGRTRAPAGN